MTTQGHTAGLTELAGRCEKLMGRDKVLGHEILLACGWRKACVGNFYGPLYYWSSPNGKRYPEDRLPCPTESLDAAMTLVPKGAEWECGSAHLINAAWANVITIDREAKGKAATPALSLTAACLRARAALESSHD